MAQTEKYIAAPGNYIDSSYGLMAGLELFALCEDLRMDEVSAECRQIYSYAYSWKQEQCLEWLNSNYPLAGHVWRWEGHGIGLYPQGPAK